MEKGEKQWISARFHLLDPCNIVIYKNRMFGHSDDPDIFLMYTGSSSTVPGPQMSKLLCFPEQ